MHIKSGELGQPGTGRQNEAPGTVRKLRLGGGASRVPVQTKAVDSPLRTLVSAIGQSLGSRSQGRSQANGSKTPSTTRTSLFSNGSKSNAASSSTPVKAENRNVASSSSSGRYGNNLFSSSAPSVAERSTGTAGKTNSSRVPSTPSSTRKVPVTPAPSRIPSTPASSSRVPSTPGSSRIPSTPASSSRIPSTPACSSRIPSTPSSYRVPSTPASTRIPSTPGSSRLRQQASAAVPATPAAARRSSLSSSTSSSSSLSTGGVRNQSLSSTKPVSRKNATTVTPSTTSRKANPGMTTPVSKNTSMPLRTPKAGSNNPTTPSSRVSSVPTPRRPAGFGSSTPGARTQQLQQASAHHAGNMGALPLTPVSKPTYADPSTPVHGVQHGYSTPLSEREGSNLTFYTPNSTLPLTPLQPKNFNVPESSRKLQFDSNGEAMADQENLGTRTPKAYHASSIPEATFTFDRNRLAQIKARRNNASQLLRSPAQRVLRVHDPNQYHQSSHTPGRVGGLQQVAEDRSARFDDDGSIFGMAKSPVKRRVANSLF